MLFSSVTIFLFAGLHAKSVQRRSSFLRRIISQVINKILKKQLPGTEVQLGEVQANWSEKDQKLKIHLVVDAEMTKPQLMELLKQAGVL